jgi:uncharacterized membrane protein YhhN
MAPPPWARIFSGLFGAVAVVGLAAELAGARILFEISLVLLVPLLAAAVVAARRRVDPQRRSRLLHWTLLALLFSWFGDTLGFDFLVKVGFFLLAQVCYLLALWPYRRQSVLWRPALRRPYLVVVAALIALVAQDAGGLAVAVVVYGVSLALMATLSDGVHRLAGLGGALFVVSDAILALDTFAPWFGLPHASFWNILSYAAAQALLARGALARVARDGPAAG